MVADLEDVEEMRAEGPARRVGRRAADIGFAGSGVSIKWLYTVNGNGEAHLEAPARRLSVWKIAWRLKMVVKDNV